MKSFFLLLVPFTVFAEFGSPDSENLSQLTSNSGYIRTDVSDIETLVRSSESYLNTINSNVQNMRNWLIYNPSSAVLKHYIYDTGGVFGGINVTPDDSSYANNNFATGLYNMLIRAHSNQAEDMMRLIVKVNWWGMQHFVANTNYYNRSLEVGSAISNLVEMVVDDNKLFHDVYTNLFSYSFNQLSNEIDQVIGLIHADTNIATQIRNILEANTNILGRIEKVSSLGFDNTTNSIVNFARQVQDQYADYTNYLNTTVFKFPSPTANNYYYYNYSVAGSAVPTADSNLRSSSISFAPQNSFTQLLFTGFNNVHALMCYVTKNQAQNIKNLQDIRRILTSWSNNVHVVVDSMPEINIDIPSNGFDRAYDQSSVIHSEIGYLWHPSVTNAITQGSELVAPQYNSVPLNGDFFHDVVNLLEGQIQQNNSANITLYTMLSLLQGTNATLEEVKHEVDDTLNDTQSAVSSAINSFSQPSNISALPDDYDLGQTLDLFQDVYLPTRVTIDMSTYAKNYSFLDKHLDGANFVWTLDIRPAFWCFRLMRAISIVILITIFIQFYFWLAYFFVKFVWYIGIIFINRK